MNLKEELKALVQLKNGLERKDIDLIISDFDDTIFSTSEIRKDNILEGKRGKLGNEFIIEKYGVDNFIRKYYTGKKCNDIITRKLRENHDLILTVGNKIIQVEKIKTLNLSKYNLKIVEKHEIKPLESILYILNTLKFIPNKVTIYEDKPEYFLENRKVIEEFLGIELEIMYVEMLNNNSPIKITKK